MSQKKAGRKGIISRNPIVRLIKFLFYYVIAIPLLFFGTQWFLGLRVKGWRNIKKLKGKGFVIACSHNHYFDCVAQGLLLCPRRGYFTSMAKTFSWPVVGQLIRLLNAVPVPEEPGKMKDFFREMAGRVQQGEIMLMYPEGELVHFCRHLREFHDGAFMVAAMAQAPVVPAVVTFRKRRGLYRIIKRRPCLTITAGEPVYPKTDSSLRREAHRLGLEVRQKMEQLMREQSRFDETPPSPQQEAIRWEESSPEISYTKLSSGAAEALPQSEY